MIVGRLGLWFQFMQYAVCTGAEHGRGGGKFLSIFGASYSQSSVSWLRPMEFCRTNYKGQVRKVKRYARMSLLHWPITSTSISMFSTDKFLRFVHVHSNTIRKPHQTIRDYVWYTVTCSLMISWFLVPFSESTFGSIKFCTVKSPEKFHFYCISISRVC